MNPKNTEKLSIEIYKPKKGLPLVEVHFSEDTVWLTQKEISLLFGVKRPAITKHLGNIFSSKELQEKSVSSILEHTATDGKRYKTKFYNLDAIISVGYRVNSGRATQFRIWATNILKNHLVQGYTINESRLKTQAQKYQELQKSIKLLENVLSLDEITQEQARGIMEVVTDYAYALDILDQYDFKTLSLKKTTKKEHYKITYDESIKLIENLKQQFGGSDIFGVPKDNSFKSSVNNIYQSVGGKDAYPSIEEKAAHLLYFVTKNHSFVDGNKRIAATLFVHFLDQNKILYRKDGSKRLPDTTLIALTVLIAQSKPEERDTIIKVIVNLINKEVT